MFRSFLAVILLTLTVSGPEAEMLMRLAPIVASEKVSEPEPAVIVMLPEMLKLLIVTLSWPFRNEMVIPVTELKVPGLEDWLTVVPVPATWRTPEEACVIVMALLP